MLTATTKPNGSGRNWLELGQYITDEFDDSEWRPSAERYPHRDSRLKVKRGYDGKGASQKIHWKIIVPDGYPLTIVQKWADGDMVVLHPVD